MVLSLQLGEINIAGDVEGSVATWWAVACWAWALGIWLATLEVTLLALEVTFLALWTTLLALEVTFLALWATLATLWAGLGTAKVDGNVNVLLESRALLAGWLVVLRSLQLGK